MDTISACMFQKEHNYYLAVIKAESLYQLSIFQYVRLKLCTVICNVVKQSQYGFDGVIYISMYIEWVKRNT